MNLEEFLCTEEAPFDVLVFPQDRPIKDSPQESALVERVFRHYRKIGFPYVECEAGQIFEEFDRLRATPTMLVEGTVRQSMIGLTLANAFHPEMVGVQCRSFKTPLEVFNDDGLLREAIRKRIRFGRNLKPWGIRKILFSMRRTQRVSNFRPSAAKSIYEFFQPRLTVDFSAGWGGRMLGAMASNTPYIGIDPHATAVGNNLRMWAAIEAACAESFDVTLVQACAEDVLGKGKWEPDLIFTSPPYFDVERYSDEPTQSYRRWPTPDAWYEGFLHQSLRGAFSDLSPGGYMVLNVNPDMEDHTCALATDEGFDLIDRWELQLSRHQYNKKSCSVYRMEPILVFGKGTRQLPAREPPPNILDFFS